MPHPLDNVLWNCFSGPHRHVTIGTDDILRYAPGFSPIIGFAEPDNPNLAGLRDHTAIGEELYCDGWSGESYPGWEIHRQTTMFRMVYHGQAPEVDPAPDAIRLGTEHVEKAIELATLTNPGPFGPRTIDLGEYFGFFDGDKLISMAGERFQVDHYHEISAVCTHPDYQGKGLAKKLMGKLLYRQMQRGKTPFLHVISTNDIAHNLYLKLGFQDYLESVVRVISRVE
ncbi:MAG: GNAT family N-acetyltransferase [Chthonomonadales bacterium]